MDIIDGVVWLSSWSTNHVNTDLLSIYFIKTCPSPLWVRFTSGTLDSFRWESCPASLRNGRWYYFQPVSEMMHNRGLKYSSISQAGKSPYNLYSVGMTYKTQPKIYRLHKYSCRPGYILLTKPNHFQFDLTEKHTKIRLIQRNCQIERIYKRMYF